MLFSESKMAKIVHLQDTKTENMYKINADGKKGV